MKSLNMLCYTIFTSGGLGGLIEIEIYIYNFDEQIIVIDQMWGWISPGNFLLSSDHIK